MRQLTGVEARVTQGAILRPAARTRRCGAFVRLWARENGNTLVETALVFPVLATVILAIFSCGILFNNYIQLTNATGAGADYLQTIRQTSTDPCHDTFTAVANAAAALNKNNITVKVVLNSTDSTTTSASSFTGTGNSTSCSGQQTLLVQQAPATVTVSYPASLIIYGRNFFATNAQISQTVTIFEN